MILVCSAILCKTLHPAEQSCADNTKWHDKIVQYIKDKGTVYAFHKKYDYSKRELVEAQISRIKRCIGTSLLTQKIESQKGEGIIIGNIINKWNMMRGYYILENYPILPEKY